MTKEEKQLFLVDLCGRLTHGVKGKVYAEVSDGKYDISGDMIFYDAPFDVILDGINVSTEEIHVVAIGNEDTVEFIEIQQTDAYPYTIDDFKPYLRSMSSMTGEEKKEYKHLVAFSGSSDGAANFVDWLNKKMFAYHTIDGKDMFELGLALEAPVDMYK